MRIVVTGIGLVTPLGDNFWECVANGRFKGVKIQGYKKGPDRFLDLAQASIERAISDAGLSQDMLERAGITISSSKGGLAFHMPSVFKTTGPVVNVISACATGLNSIIIGVNIIKTYRARIVLSGGVDSCLTSFMLHGYRRLGVLAKDGVCRPYSKNRSGFVLSEGACVVVLEELHHACERGAKIYGEITGWASLADAYHITSMDPSGEAISHAIKLCISGPIDYINTHGTGTVENDIIETKAIKKFFGKKAYNIPLSSTKGVTGHMLGASGAIEFAIGLLAMKNGFIPPTANLDEPDPLCDLDYTPNVGRVKQIDSFLTLSYGFGGHVACVEGRRYETTRSPHRDKRSCG